MLEESSLVLMADLGKLAEELAAHLYGRTLAARLQPQPSLAGQEGLAGGAGADPQVGLHEFEHSGVHLELEEEARVAVEQVAVVDCPAAQRELKGGKKLD